MLVQGRCHCGNIRFTLDWTPDPATMPARACSCTFCTKHGAVWTAKPDGVLEIEVGDASRLSRYAFGTRTAEFLTCTGCGVVPAALSRIDGRLYAVVNVHTFENVDPARLQPAPASFDDETEAQRLARRKQRWIADVRYVERAAPTATASASPAIAS